MSKQRLMYKTVNFYTKSLKCVDLIFQNVQSLDEYTDLFEKKQTLFI